VKNVRPYVSTAYISNVTMTDKLIASLMDLQEKLHFGLGRNRKKLAIGVHNYEPVTPPFTYKAVDPDSVQFIPLAKEDSMTLREILTKHEKGIDYAFTLDGFDTYPLIIDSNNNVLSFPPIINGRLTEVTPYTKEIFIDVTGTDRKSINYALSIISTALAERGCVIYQTTVHDGNTSFLSPDLNPTKRDLSIEYVNKILGTDLHEDEVITCLEKMGYNTQFLGNKKLTVGIPAWRSDILHEIDLVEDVAIGYGFDIFQTDFPTSSTFGKTLPHFDLLRSLRTIMIGLGFNEVTTFTISNEADEFTNLGLEIGKSVEIQNPIGEEYSILRPHLLPSLLKILRENRHHPLPQQIFELGIVVNNHAKNCYHLAGVKIDAKANFTESKSIIETILRGIGCPFTLKEMNHAAYIQGRCAAVIWDSREIGIFGELHPRTIRNFDLEHPIIAFEFNIDVLH
jgi:phenylalanyl-tRNA synthetase beta chain